MNWADCFIHENDGPIGRVHFPQASMGSIFGVVFPKESAGGRKKLRHRPGLV